MSDYKQNSSSPTRIQNLSPEKYGKAAFRELTYTPDKLYQNYLYKEVTVNKKLEEEKKRIRELESENSIYQQKIKQSQIEIQTVRRSLNLQIDMYKNMIKEQEEDKSKHIKIMQTNFSAEIEKLLYEHEEDSKVAQAEKEELQDEVIHLLQRIKQLEHQLKGSNNQADDLSNKLTSTLQNLKNTEQKLMKSEQLAKLNADRSTNQINSLNQRLEKQRTHFKQQFQSAMSDKNREIEGLKKLQQTELEKLQNRRSAELAAKNLEIKEITNSFQSEGRRLDDIILQKDRVNTNLNNDLNREKQRVLSLTKHYQNQLNQLLNQKDHLLKDLETAEKQKSASQLEVQDLKLTLSNERNRADNVIQGLTAEFNHNNGGLARQNENLLRAMNTLEHEIAFLREQNRALKHDKQVEGTKFKISTQTIHDENRLMASQIKNLRDILLQSSLQMEKCKEQFIRMDRQRERLIRLSQQYEQQSLRLKQLLTQKEIDVRQWRESYYGLKSRY